MQFIYKISKIYIYAATIFLKSKTLVFSMIKIHFPINQDEQKKIKERERERERDKK